MKSTPEFLAIGDITTDAFIRIKDASVHCDINRANCELCVRFGDKVPYEDVYVVPAVGNSPNASVSASRLGLRSGLVANIGDDQNGKDCLAQLKKDNVDTSLIAIHKGMKSNYHYVLWYEEERTILVKHQPYKYQLPNLGEPKWIYLSSLGNDSVAYQNGIASYVRAHPSVKLAFQPGTFQMQAGYKALKDVYATANVFFCNKEEAQRILDSKSSEIKELIEGVHRIGPKVVAITDGPNGAYASDGSKILYVPCFPDPRPPLNRTGAGDAFASTFTVALALGLPLETALMWGPVNSAYVIQGIGAQAGLLTREQLEGYLAKAPAQYKVKQI